MTDDEFRLLSDFYELKISEEELSESFGKLLYDSAFVKREIRSVLLSGKIEHVEIVLELLWLQNDDVFTEELNLLLASPHHRSHQEVTKEIQRIGCPSSIPSIVEVLSSDFSQFDYTCSEVGTIAKWFSWALAAIGTPEALKVIEDLSFSGKEGIGEEMQYRLKKLRAEST